MDGAHASVSSSASTSPAASPATSRASSPPPDAELDERAPSPASSSAASREASPGADSDGDSDDGGSDAGQAQGWVDEDSDDEYTARAPGCRIPRSIVVSRRTAEAMEFAMREALAGAVRAIQASCAVSPNYGLNQDASPARDMSAMKTAAAMIGADGMTVEEAEAKLAHGGKNAEAILSKIKSSPEMQQALRVGGSTAKNAGKVALLVGGKALDLAGKVGIDAVIKAVEFLIPFLLKIVIHTVFVDHPDYHLLGQTLPGSDATLEDLVGAVFAREFANRVLNPGDAGVAYSGADVAAPSFSEMLVDQALRLKPAGAAPAPAAGDDVAASLQRAIAQKFGAARGMDDDAGDEWDDAAAEDLVTQVLGRAPPPPPPPMSKAALEELVDAGTDALAALAAPAAPAVEAALPPAARAALAAVAPPLPPRPAPQLPAPMQARLEAVRAGVPLVPDTPLKRLNTAAGLRQTAVGAGDLVITEALASEATAEETVAASMLPPAETARLLDVIARKPELGAGVRGYYKERAAAYAKHANGGPAPAPTSVPDFLKAVRRNESNAAAAAAIKRQTAAALASPEFANLSGAVAGAASDAVRVTAQEMAQTPGAFAKLLGGFKRTPAAPAGGAADGADGAPAPAAKPGVLNQLLGGARGALTTAGPIVTQAAGVATGLAETVASMFMRILGSPEFGKAVANIGGVVGDVAGKVASEAITGVGKAVGEGAKAAIDASPDRRTHYGAKPDRGMIRARPCGLDSIIIRNSRLCIRHTLESYDPFIRGNCYARIMHETEQRIAWHGDEQRVWAETLALVAGSAAPPSIKAHFLKHAQLTPVNTMRALCDPEPPDYGPRDGLVPLLLRAEWTRGVLSYGLCIPR